MIGKIKYGDVVLDLVKVNSVTRRPIFSDDGVDYLFTETTVNATATLNPSATSFASLVANIPQAGNAYAGRTDRILHDYLSQPRRVLKMWSIDANGNHVVYLESPPAVAPPRRGRQQHLATDAKNGPQCRVFAINGVDVHGAKTWLLMVEFVTWVNNCLDSTSPILSHRWETNVDYDDQYRAIVTRTGHVVFHAGRLWSANQSPDFYRREFFRPPPSNFAREHVNVNIGSDNCSATYTVTDAERFYLLGASSPAVKLEAMLTTWYTQGSVPQAVGAAAPELNANLTPQWTEYAVPWLYPVRQGLSGTRTVAKHIVSQLPNYRSNIVVRAWGARNSARNDLFALCMAVAFARLGAPDFFFRASKTEFIVAQDLMDNFCELQMTLSMSEALWVQIAGIVGPPGSIGNTIGLVLTNDNGLKFIGSHFVAPTPTNPLGNDTVTQPRPVGILPPAAAGAGNALTAGIQYVAAATLAAIRAGLDFGGAGPVANAGVGGAIGGVAGGVAGLPILTQQSIGSRPMNNVPNSPDRNSRGIGYAEYLLTQALLQQCQEVPMPGKWDTPSTPRAAAVTGVRPPLLPIDDE